MRVPDEIRQCVVFVGLPTSSPNGRQGIVFQGTGFFITIPFANIQHRNYVYLVTAKHVATKLEGKTFLVRINTKDGSSALVTGEGVRWWYHPTDESVDVALIPYAPDTELFEYKTIPSSMFLSDDTIRSKNIGAGDEVFITGLFAHLTGSARNLPIVRIGNIAMMPGEPVPTKEYGDIEAYLIEARSIGGLSGSPVFVRETVSLGIGSFHLLGLMHGHWDIPPQSRNDLIQSDGDRYAAVNMGIAIVVPAKKVLEVLNQPQLVDARRAREEEVRKQTMPTLDEQVEKVDQKQEVPKDNP